MSNTVIHTGKAVFFETLTFAIFVVSREERMILKKCFSKSSFQHNSDYREHFTERPHPTAYFEVIQESIMGTSVTLKWKPRYNGGLHQTFIIQYRKSGDK